MASSTVDVVNMALALLGARPIASLTEGTKAASLAATSFNDERDATLRAHPWKFAGKRAQLAKDQVAPLFEWASSFQLPTNPFCLRVRRIKDGWPYVIEARKLLTNADTAVILFTARVESPTEWDALFTSALAARMAMTMAYPLTEQASLQKQMADLYVFKLAEARSIDSQEGSTQEAGSDILVDVRGGTYNRGRRSGWTME